MKTLTMTVEVGVTGPAVREHFKGAPAVVIVDTAPLGELLKPDRAGVAWTKFGYHERGVIFYQREVEG